MKHLGHCPHVAGSPQMLGLCQSTNPRGTYVEGALPPRRTFGDVWSHFGCRSRGRADARGAGKHPAVSRAVLAEGCLSPNVSCARAFLQPPSLRTGFCPAPCTLSETLCLWFLQGVFYRSCGTFTCCPCAGCPPVLLQGAGRPPRFGLSEGRIRVAGDPAGCNLSLCSCSLGPWCPSWWHRIDLGPLPLLHHL